MKPKNAIESKDKALFDRIAKKYASKDEVRSCSIPREFILKQAMAPLLKEGRRDHVIVDIACGIGAPAGYLKGKYRKYYGVDHSSEMIDIAREKYKDHDGVFFLNANVKESLRIDEKVDVILAVGALHHITELDKVFNSLKKIVSPGAVFVAIEPYGGNPVITLMRRLRMMFDKGYSSDQVFFKKRDITKILRDNGFRDIEVVHQGFFSPPFAQVILEPQVVTIGLARVAVFMDRVIEKYLNWLVGPLSWNIIVKAKF